MKILIISVFFPQENTIASLRIYSWAKYWSQMGHEVTVLTTKKAKSATDLNFDVSNFTLKELPLPGFLEKFIFPNKGQNISAQSNSSSKTKSKILKDYIRITVYAPFKFILNRLRRYGAFSALRMPDKFDLWYFPAYNFARQSNWDIVVSSYGPYVSHLLAHKLKKTGKCNKWVADYRDLWTMNQAFNYGLFPFNFYEEYLERKFNNYADIVTTVSEPLAQKLRDKYARNDIHTIENGFDFEDIISLNKAAYWDDNKIHIAYTGSIYEGKQNPEPIFKAIAMISKSADSTLLDNFQLLFFGKMPPTVISLVKKYNIEKWVIFKGFVLRAEVLRIQRDAHALLFLEFNTCEGILSGKIFEYLASKTMILSVGGTNPNSYVSNFIGESQCARVLGEDVGLITNEILELLKNKNKLVTDSGFALKYSRKNLAEKMLQLFA